MEWWTKSYLILRLLGHRPNRATGANRANRANGANKPDGANGPNRPTGRISRIGESANQPNGIFSYSFLVLFNLNS